MVRSLRALFIGAGLALAAAALFGAQTQAPVPIETVPVVVKKLEKTIALPGDLSAYQSVAIYPKISGFVESIAVDRGSWVKPGDSIALLTAPEIEGQQVEAEARVQRIESQRTEAEAKVAALTAALAASESNIAVARANVAGATSMLAGAQSHVVEAQSMLAGAEATLTGTQATLANLQTTYDRIKKASETPGAVAGNDLDAALRAVETGRAAVGAQRASVEAHKANVETLRQGLDAQRSSIEAQQAGIQAQQAGMRAQQAGIEAQRSAVEALRNERMAAEAAVGVIKTMKGYLRVTAPFAGVITERNAHSGSLVGPTPSALNPPLVRIDDIARLRLTVGVPEAYVGAIGAGARVSFAAPAYPDEVFHGVIQRQAHTLDPRTRTMAVEIDVENPGARLSPGMFVNVNWPLTRAITSSFVPPSAIVNTTEKTFVIAVRDGAAVWVDVRRGVNEGALMEVFGSLRPADVVVKRGTDEIRPGTKLIAK